MHYYQFNIGDYASHTRHLSLMEDLAYRRLLDLYYLHEEPISDCLTSVARLIGMKDYENEVSAVLNEFFTPGIVGWENIRANKEIAHYHSKIEQASKAGKASAERRFNARSTDVQPNINQEPITKNHNKATIVATPEGVSDSVWQDFKTLRKAKKAPITERALEGLRTEAKKAGWTLEQALSECCVRGWQAFKADWVAQKPSFQDVIHQTTPTPANHDAALRKIEEDAKRAVKPNAEVQARIAELLKGKV